MPAAFACRFPARFIAPFVILASLLAPPFADAAKDRTPPTVKITSPAAGAVSGVVVITATATDNVSVQSVKFFRDGVLLGSDSTAPFQRSWSTAGFSGSHVLTAVARDPSGNSATSSPVTVSIADASTPVVRITAPANGATVSGAVGVNATASDDSGAVDVAVSVDGSRVGDVQAGGWSGTWDTTPLTNGTHTVTASAWDGSGNTAAASVTVTVSNGVAPPPPPPGQRKLASNGTDNGDCSVNPCATFDYAYHQAKPGDTVAVAAGTYTNAIASGDVILNYDASKVGAAPVTFLGQGTVTVELGSTTTVNHSPDIRGAQNVVFDGVNFLHGSIGVIPQFGSGCGVNANGVTLRNLSVNGAISIRNAQNLLVQNVQIGGFTYPDPGIQDAWGDSSRVGDYDCGARASHVTFDRVRWHDIYRGSSPSHAECLFIERSDYVSVVNSRLEACPIMGIFLKNDSGVSDGSNYQDHVLIQNNFISQPCPTGGPATPAECGSRGIQESDCDNNAYIAAPSSPLQWTVRFNSLGPGASIWVCEPSSYWSSSSVLEGNIVDSLTGGCSTVGNWTVSYNVWTGGQSPCSTTGSKASAGSLFTSPSTFDYHLVGGVTPSVPAAACIATDIDGEARPAAAHPSACDAGADER